MNRLTLKIKNKTRYVIPKRIKGELLNELNVLVLGIEEFKKASDKNSDVKAVIAFGNSEKPIDDLLEKYLSRIIPTMCIANEEISSGLSASVIVYLSHNIGQTEIDEIIRAIHATSLLIVNSSALYLDNKVYSCVKKKKAVSDMGHEQQSPKESDDDSYVHILRQPLDAVVLPRTINDELEPEKLDGFALGRNSKTIIVNLDNLNFEECITFVEEEKIYNDVKEYGVYKDDGTWLKRKTETGLKDNQISISPYITRRLCNGGRISLDNLLLLRVEGIEINEIGVANIDKVLGGTVQISKEILSRIDEDFPAKTDYCLIHNQTGSRMVIEKSGLEEKTLASKSKICLNYYQRALMGLQPSSDVIQSLLHTAFYSDKHNKEELNEKIQRILSESGEDEYLKKERLKRILESGGYSRTKIFPEFDTYGKRRNNKNLFQRIWSAYTSRTVGTKSIQLRCSRPYNVDEVSRIVRLASDKIAILGIEPTDIVTLRYKDKSTRARVLPFDINNDWKEIQLTNLVGGDDDKAEVEAMIGIPAAIRDELEIPNINVAVSVERDAEYVFHKNSNVQFLPIVALIFSVFDLCSTFAESLPVLSQILIAIGFTLVLTPFVFYIMLSGERAKVKSKLE